MKVCIDPGHGGSDPGAVGNGLQEKDLTLAISLQVAKAIKAAGLTVIMTRAADQFVDLNSQRTPEADISVSIHVNSGGGQGLETWISLFNQPIESQKLGQAIQSAVLGKVPFISRGLKSKENSSGTADYLYMIRKPAGVAVLVECGFIDSAIDAAILQSEGNQGQIAAGIAAGILEYLNVEDAYNASIDKLVTKGIITSGDYWKQAVASGTAVRGDWMAAIIERMTGKSTQADAISALVAVGAINSPGTYWLTNCVTGQTVAAAYVKVLIINAVAKLGI